MPKLVTPTRVSGWVTGRQGRSTPRRSRRRSGRPARQRSAGSAPPCGAAPRRSRPPSAACRLLRWGAAAAGAPPVWHIRARLPCSRRPPALLPPRLPLLSSRPLLLPGRPALALVQQRQHLRSAPQLAQLGLHPHQRSCPQAPPQSLRRMWQLPGGHLRCGRLQQRSACCRQLRAGRAGKDWLLSRQRCESAPAARARAAPGCRLAAVAAVPAACHLAAAPGACAAAAGGVGSEHACSVTVHADSNCCVGRQCCPHSKHAALAAPSSNTPPHLLARRQVRAVRAAVAVFGALLAAARMRHAIHVQAVHWWGRAGCGRQQTGLQATAGRAGWCVRTHGRQAPRAAAHQAAAPTLSRRRSHPTRRAQSAPGSLQTSQSGGSSR